MWWVCESGQLGSTNTIWHLLYGSNYVRPGGTVVSRRWSMPSKSSRFSDEDEKNK